MHHTTSTNGRLQFDEALLTLSAGVPISTVDNNSKLLGAIRRPRQD